MTIELSNLTFTELDDIVPASGEEQIVNTGIANTLAGNDIITGTSSDLASSVIGIENYTGVINTGDGNDTLIGTGIEVLLSYGIVNQTYTNGPVGTINTGAGKDTIIASGSYYAIYNNLSVIDTGADDDEITATGTNGIVNQGIINTSDGRDIITGNAINGLEPRPPGGIYNSGIYNISIIDTGNDNDTITGIGEISIDNYRTIDTGNGKDSIFSDGKFINYGEVFLGGGGDSIILETYFDFSEDSLLENSNFIDTGEGNDTITAYGGNIYNSGVINTGDGNDNITRPQNFYNNGVIDTGEGDDYIDSGTLTNYEVINTGNGDDLISGSSINNYGGTINTGNGNDDIYAASGGFQSAEGSTTNTGDGNDEIFSQTIFINRGNVFLGEGNDSITASVFPDGAIENFGFIGTGNGNDMITSADIIYNEGVIETGNGDDSIIVDGGVDDITGTTYGIKNNGGAINMGDGNDSIIANQGFESGPNSSGAWFLGEGEDYIKGYGSGDFYGGNGNDTLELTPGTYTVGIWGEAGESPIFTKGDQLMITSEFEKLKAGATIYDFTSLTAGQIIVVA